MADDVIPPPPPGFTLDEIPPPPEGFTLDSGEKPRGSYLSRVGHAALRGLPGGPLGVAASLGVQGLDELGQLSDAYGYKAGGAVTDVAAKVLPPEVAAGAGVATNVALSQAIPAAIGGGAAKAVASPVMRRLSEYLMRRALNPTSKQWMSGQGPQAVRTMLDEPFGAAGKAMPGANIHEVGLEQLKGKASEVFSQALEAAARGDNQAFSQLSGKLKELGNAFELAEKAAGKTSQVGGIGMFYHRLVTLLAYLGSHSPLAQSMAARGLNIGKNTVPYAAGGLANAAVTAPYGQEPQYQTLEDKLP